MIRIAALLNRIAGKPVVVATDAGVRVLHTYGPVTREQIAATVQRAA